MKEADDLRYGFLDAEELFGEEIVKSDGFVFVESF
jgi:hypothetical protein